MFNVVYLPIPELFNFRQVLVGHGWSALAPFELDMPAEKLHCVLYDIDSERPIRVSVEQVDKNIEIKFSKGVINNSKILDDVKHIFRLDEDLSGFYAATEKVAGLEWIGERFGGRLLRSPTVFEDLVKTMCTTNCSWALTKIMVRNLVEKLGSPAVDGGYAFPTPQAMAAEPEQFYREEIKAGYRAPYLKLLAERTARGELDTGGMLNSPLSTAELKKELLKIKGFGQYAADNMLKLLGRYDGLALDSYLRGEFYKRYNKGKKCKDSRIEKHYKGFGVWRGLAIWCDMSRPE